MIKHFCCSIICIFQGAKWKRNFIFITSTETRYKVYAFNDNELQSKSSGYFQNEKKLMPIQKLSRYWSPKSTTFVEMNNELYCLLGANSIEENR